ncbi:hypothetical protein KKE38_00005, partial [Candidatus Micrarchaeota archaeon]|nr:hypothetical protein [Candidatus Micrarchaeota archaeon]
MPESTSGPESVSVPESVSASVSVSASRSPPSTTLPSTGRGGGFSSLPLHASVARPKVVATAKLATNTFILLNTVLFFWAFPSWPSFPSFLTSLFSFTFAGSDIFYITLSIIVNNLFLRATLYKYSLLHIVSHNFPNLAFLDEKFLCNFGCSLCMAPRIVILDTNFLLVPFQFKINVIKELDYLLEVSHKFVISSRTIVEL